MKNKKFAFLLALFSLLITGCDFNLLPQTNKNSQNASSVKRSENNISSQIVHTYSDEWSYNEKNHWHACIDPGYESLKSDETSHSFVSTLVAPTYDEEGYTLYTCRVCNYSYKGNYVSILVHNYSGTFEYDENYHWRRCTDSGYEDLKINNNAHTLAETVVAPTYDREGYTLHKCTVCGYSYKDNFVSVRTHTYSDQWSYDENSHWHACIDPGYRNLRTDEGEHNFNLEVVSDEFLAREACCQGPALYYRSCVCGAHSQETFEYGEKGTHFFEKTRLPNSDDFTYSTSFMCEKCKYCGAYKYDCDPNLIYYYAGNIYYYLRESTYNFLFAPNEDPCRAIFRYKPADYSLTNSVQIYVDQHLGNYVYQLFYRSWDLSNHSWGTPYLKVTVQTDSNYRVPIEKKLYRLNNETGKYDFETLRTYEYYDDYSLKTYHEYSYYNEQLNCYSNETIEEYLQGDPHHCSTRTSIYRTIDEENGFVNETLDEVTYVKGTFNFSTRIIKYKYLNADGDIISTHAEKWDYTYNEDGEEILREYFHSYSFKNNEWIWSPYSKDETIIEEFKTTYSFYMYASVEMCFVLRSSTVETYDVEHNILRSESYGLNGNSELELESYYLYEYTEDGLTTKRSYYRLNDNSEFFCESIYIYTVDGSYSESYSYAYDSEKGCLVPTYKTTCSTQYNDLGEWVSAPLIQYKWSDEINDWVLMP